MIKKKISIFCGGRGSASIIKYFVNQKNFDLTLLINAYDDGKSTGVLRKNVEGLLGPSDFRKNFSYLLDIFSKEQRLLKKIIEYRIKKKIYSNEFLGELDRIKNKKKNISNFLPSEIEYLEKKLKEKIINYAIVAINNLKTKNLNLLDFSFGNLIFTGIFIGENKNFNSSIKKFAKIINNNVEIINVSSNSNRWLVAVNKKNKIIQSESKLVNKKQLSSIKDIYLLNDKNYDYFNKNFFKISNHKKNIFLKKNKDIPKINNEAKKAILNSNYIIYGPGTQFSSLFPSYMICEKTIKKSKAKKILIMNLHQDNDIIGLGTKEITIQALKYLNCLKKTNMVIDKILIDKNCEFDNLFMKFKETLIEKDDLKNNYYDNKHSGEKIYNKIFQHEKEKNLTFYIEIKNKNNFEEEYLEQISNKNWKSISENTILIFNKKVTTIKNKSIKIVKYQSNKKFSELTVFNSWYKKKDSNILITITGDGFYNLDSIKDHIDLMKKLNCGLLIGSRNKSRAQHFLNIKNIYGHNKLLYFLSIISEFLYIVIYFIKIKFIIIDPNSGYKIYCKQNFNNKFLNLSHKYPSSLLKEITQKKIEIFEVPVKYYVNEVFTEKLKRFKKNLKNIYGLFVN